MDLKKQLLLYAVTDRQWLSGRTLESDLELALKGGVTMVQLREKSLDKKSFLKQACIIAELCKHYSVPLIINDDIDICLQSGADGVHIGQNDLNASQARILIGSDKILGVTANSVQLALQAEKNGADYIGAGAVFGSSTKHNTKILDKTICKAICDSVSIPVVAIGGINQENILSLGGYGVVGVAVVSGIFAGTDITKNCKNLLALSKKMVNDEKI